MIFKNRADAGTRLAKELEIYKNNKEAIIVALPRGGVVVAFEVAKALNLPLDLVVPRKIGAPNDEEFAIGAITETGERIFDQKTIEELNITKEYLEKTMEKEQKEAKRRLKTYRVERPQARIIKNRIVIIIDDGIATGHTIRAAIKTVKNEGPKKIIVAVPTGAKDTLDNLEKEVDEVICIDSPTFYGAIGAYYTEFAQTTDDKVVELMKQSKDFGK